MTQQTTVPADDDFEFDAEDFENDVDVEDVDDEDNDQDDAPDNDDIDDESDIAPAPTKSSRKQLEIKYNGNKEVFDLETQQDQVVELLQKGRNYDHVKTELDSLKNSEETKLIQDLAKEAGYPDVKSFLLKVNQDVEARKIEARVQELTAKGVPKDHAEYTAKLEIQSKQAVPPAKDDGIEPLKQSFQSLLAQYPETANYKSLSEFPPDVITAMNAGDSPLVAYQKHLLNKERVERAKLEHNAKVKDRDIGSMKSTKDEEEDAFLAELLK
jgi:hypothetical protein